MADHEYQNKIPLAMVEGMEKADHHATAPKSVKHQQRVEGSRKKPGSSSVVFSLE